MNAPIKISSELAEISINITVSNICGAAGAPQIFSNFEPAVEK